MNSPSRRLCSKDWAINGVCLAMVAALSACALPRGASVAHHETTAPLAAPTNFTGPVLTWSVVPPRDANGVTSAELESVARQAFNGWQRAGVIRFVKAEPGEQPDVMIGFGGAPEEAKNKHAMAWSFPLGSPHAGTICLSSDVGWTTNPLKFWRQPVQWVLGNRVGHVLGVPQSQRYDSIMSSMSPPREEPSVWDLMELKKRFQRAEVVEGE